jgi:hypothetical protein
MAACRATIPEHACMVVWGRREEVDHAMQWIRNTGGFQITQGHSGKRIAVHHTSLITKAGLEDALGELITAQLAAFVGSSMRERSKPALLLLQRSHSSPRVGRARLKKPSSSLPSRWPREGEPNEPNDPPDLWLPEPNPQRSIPSLMSRPP